MNSKGRKPPGEKIGGRWNPRVGGSIPSPATISAGRTKKLHRNCTESVAIPATAPPYSGGMCSQKTVSYARPVEPVQDSPVSRHVKPYSANWKARRQKARVMAAAYRRSKPLPVWEDAPF